MNEPILLAFSANSEIVSVSGPIESNCCGILFINLGADVVTVLGFPMQQGQQLTIPCNIGEIDKTYYNALFANGSTDQKLLVIRKNY